MFGGWIGDLTMAGAEINPLLFIQGDGDTSDMGDGFVANQSMDSLLDADYDAGRQQGNGSLPSLRSTFNASGTNTLFTVFLIVNAALGAGLLNFPRAFDKAGGVGVGLSVQAVLLVFILIALVVLAYTADQNAAETIQEAMEAAGGVGNKYMRVLTCIHFGVWDE